MSKATMIFNKYGSCMMEVRDNKATYFYQDENYNWVEVREI